jgi:hypothetical protein
MPAPRFLGYSTLIGEPEPSIWETALGNATGLSSYTPTLRERTTDWLRQKLFSDDRAGQAQAEQLMNVGETMLPPVSFAASMYDAGREAGKGNYGSAAVNMAVVPFGVAAKTPVKRAALEADQMLGRAVANTKGARLVDEGLALRVSRNQKPEQEMMDSVRGGVFYLPEGSKDQKFYSGTGFNAAYGGNQPIAGETLFKNPLFVKGATGGKAPQAAFDTLNGKGAYEAMRSDALRSVPPYYLKEPDLRIELVTQFLDKYAPEMSDKASYILQSSTKGNQLAYALQEAAVASAARRAGHDGVIGHSMSRKTKEPFISEVFDVRENSYPSPDGDFQMWPQYFPIEGGSK